VAVEVVEVVEAVVVAAASAVPAVAARHLRERRAERAVGAEGSLDAKGPRGRDDPVAAEERRGRPAAARLRVLAPVDAAAAAVARAVGRPPLVGVHRALDHL